MDARGGLARRWTALVAAAVAGVVLAGYAVVIDLPLVRNLEAEALTLRFQIRGAETRADHTAVVLVDDRTIAEFGRWPLSRTHFADVIGRLNADGARVVAFDLLFTEAESAEADAALARAMAEAGNVIAPFAFVFAPGMEAAPAPDAVRASAYANVTLPEGRALSLPLAPTGLIAPVPVIAEAAAGLAHVSVLFDTDGTLRFDYPAFEYDWEYYPSLPIEAARLYLGLPRDAVELRFGEGVAVGDRAVPTDESMRILVNYMGPEGTIPTYSFADVVKGRVPAGAFRDRLVFVGANVLGINDAFTTPFSLVLPGVERQAVIVERLLAGDHLLRRDWVRLADMALIVVLGAGAVVLAAALPSAWMALGGAILLGAWAVACQIAFQAGGLWLHFTFPALAIVLGLGSVYALRARAEETERRRAEQALRVSEERYALAARGANDGLWDWDLAASRVHFAPRWQAMVGLEERAFDGPPSHWFDRVDPLDRPVLEAAAREHLDGVTRHFAHEYRLRCADGSTRWMLARGEAVRGPDGTPTRFAGSQSDVTERKRAEQALVESAFRDPLTGLANRAVLHDRLSLALARFAREPGARPAVLDVSIDGFRRVVETLGPVAADRLLIAVARRVQAASPACDTPARLGGEGFAVLVDDGAAADDRAAALHAAMAEPFMEDGRGLALTFTIGVAAPEGPKVEPGELLRDAALAAHAAREAGPGRTARFAEALRAKVERRFDLEGELRAAVRAGAGFVLFYQPIIDLATGRADAFEALIRWRHETRGLVSPGEFIPIAEETGLIVEIGRWALAEAARQAEAWRAASGRRRTIAVNVSGRQFAESDLLADVEAALAGAGATPDLLKVEVTESMVMGDPERTADTLRALMARGVKVSIDDFGTGYSSLAYLHKLPFQTLKVDRSFVMRLGEGPEALEIVRVIVNLARTLGRDIVAEGIETAEQAGILAELGVDHGQGFLFSRPLPAAEATAFTREPAAA